MLILLICLLANVVCTTLGQADVSLPQCIHNDECGETRACIDLSCQDPCPGICHGTASCEVKKHVPYCFCRPGYSGSPLTGCQEQVSGTSVSKPIGRKVYKVDRYLQLNFYAAFIHCMNKGGRLATIDSKEENDMLAEVMRKNIRNGVYWTSGTNSPLGSWVWLSTGQPFPEYSNWWPGEPSNTAGDERCMMIYERNNEIHWDDINCYHNQVFPVCEFFE